MQQNLVNTVSTVRQNAEGVASRQRANRLRQQRPTSARTEQQASALEETRSLDGRIWAPPCARTPTTHAPPTSWPSAPAPWPCPERRGRSRRDHKGINASSNKIADIISVIDGIAFRPTSWPSTLQSKPPAPANKAEACRGGWRVRNLAGRSAEAAKEIKAPHHRQRGTREQGTALVDKSRSHHDRSRQRHPPRDRHHGLGEDQRRQQRTKRRSRPDRRSRHANGPGHPAAKRRPGGRNGRNCQRTERPGRQNWSTPIGRVQTGCQQHIKPQPGARQRGPMAGPATKPSPQQPGATPKRQQTRQPGAPKTSSTAPAAPTASAAAQTGSARPAPAKVGGQRRRLELLTGQTGPGMKVQVKTAASAGGTCMTAIKNK